MVARLESWATGSARRRLADGVRGALETKTKIRTHRRPEIPAPVQPRHSARQPPNIQGNEQKTEEINKRKNQR